jgi:hypothetical protein
MILLGFVVQEKTSHGVIGPEIDGISRIAV